jgi:hypothetical protein
LVTCDDDSRAQQDAQRGLDDPEGDGSGEAAPEGGVDDDAGDVHADDGENVVGRRRRFRGLELGDAGSAAGGLAHLPSW